MRFIFLIAFIISGSLSSIAQMSDIMEPLDVFELEFVSDPQISPDGKKIIYVRNFKDIMTDKNLSNLWMIDADGKNNRPLTTGNQNDYSPRWSSDGSQIVYVSNKDGKSQIYLRWLDTSDESKLSNLQYGPGSVSWSPNGKMLAFTMFVPGQKSSLVSLPAKPAGANWIEPPVYIDKMKYRADGAGFLPPGNTHIFVISTDGGTAKQITDGDYNYAGPLSWSTDNQTVLTSSNQHEDRDYDPNNSEVFSINVTTGKKTALTSRKGPDQSAKYSPDGTKIAYLGYDDKYLGYQQNRLYVMNSNGSGSREILKQFDRSVQNIQWSGDGKGIYFQYDDEGNTKIAFTDLAGKQKDLANNVGGMSLGRPYGAGTYTVAANGSFAFTHSTPDHPADLASGSAKSTEVKRLTELNADLFSYKKLGAVEEIWYESSADKQKIQGWICKPPNFDPSKKYPLMLEIHGGPFANYGDRFSAEIQLYAAAGYVVLYTNPRGSTSYGAEFGNLIHHNYPSEDYDDLMSGIDAVIAKGYVDTDQLYITGGSGGGVLTAWSIGKTNRFRAAVVAKPVINWYSFVLHADNPGFFAQYWFPGNPWEYQDHYMKRSPISLVGNVKTPTMLLTGEIDYRTPMSETEQYYAALKLNRVPSAMVRIQGAGHGIANRPSNLVSKVVYILGWFDKYKE
jgi:dipeptidyl aminopeptidase/acylaminoacyl peptidase